MAGKKNDDHKVEEEKVEEPKPVLRELDGSPAEGTENADIEVEVNPLLINDPREIPVEQAIEEAGGNKTRPDTAATVVVEEKVQPLGEEDNKEDIAADRGDEEE